MNDYPVYKNALQNIHISNKYSHTESSVGSKSRNVTKFLTWIKRLKSLKTRTNTVKLE